jgi:hypothetical protein
MFDVCYSQSPGRKKNLDIWKTFFKKTVAFHATSIAAAGTEPKTAPPSDKVGTCKDTEKPEATISDKVGTYKNVERLGVGGEPQSPPLQHPALPFTSTSIKVGTYKNVERLE